MVDGNGNIPTPANGGPVTIEGDQGRRDPEGSRVPSGDRVERRPDPGRPADRDPYGEFLKNVRR
jgi:hypothetical protein